MNEAKSHCKLKENIKLMKSQRSDIESDEIIKDCEKWELMN